MPTIDKSTGYQALDRAMIEAARRAQPYPLVPQGYEPGKEVVAFRIPIWFTIKDRS